MTRSISAGPSLWTRRHSCPLRWFYDSLFRPNVAAEFSAHHRNAYDQAIRHFLAFAGEQTLLGDVTDELLAAFIAAGEGTGRSMRNWRTLAGLVRRVVLTWNDRAVRKPRLRVAPLPPAEPGTVREYFETTYATEAMVGATDSSIEETRRTFRVLRTFMGRDVKLNEQCDKLAADFFRWLLKSGLSTATVNAYRRRWFAVWRHAFDRNLVDRPPRVKRIKEIRNPPDAWTWEQYSAILQAASTFQRLDTYGEIRCNLFWQALLLTEYYTALRFGSLMAICREHVDLKTGVLYVPGENMKNRQGQVFQLGKDAIAAIDAIWTPRRVLLFDCQCRKWKVLKHFSKLLAAAHVPAGRRKHLSKFHKLRRTVATLLAARAGRGAASALLGHSGEYVTRLYIDPTQLPAHDVTEILPRLCVG